jgi:hypothetical protein
MFALTPFRASAFFGRDVAPPQFLDGLCGFRFCGHAKRPSQARPNFTLLVGWLLLVENERG